MTVTSVTPRLKDVVAALEQRDRHEEAEYYREIFPFLLSLVYGVPQEEIMGMAIDDLVELPNMPQKPLKYEGWDTFHFGRAAFGNNP